MDIMEEMDKLADILVELVERDRNYTHVKVFIKNCGNADIQREWSSLMEKEQRAVADELYYYHRSSNL